MIRFDTRRGEIIVRPFALQDIDAQIAYLYDSPDEFLEKIGFDLSKRSARELRRERIIKGVESDQLKGTFYSAAAQLGTETIAAIHLPLRELPDVPRAHFHIYDSNLRGKGLGAPILKSGLKLLLAEHKISRIFIEPKIDNLPMNKLMTKAGFRFLGETVYSGPVTTAFQANRYEVTLELLG